MEHLRDFTNKTPFRNTLLNEEDYCSKARQLLEKNQWIQAQKILQRGLLEIKKTGEAYHLLGLAFYHQGFFKVALAEFQKACSIEQVPEYYINWSIALNELGYYDKAKQAYEKAILLSSQSKEQNWKQEIAEKHLKTAETYLKKNELKAALGECIKSLRFHPDQPATQIKVASLFWKLKQKKIAEQYLRKFINTKPQNIKARLLLAQWYFESRQIPQAINEWENILRTNPNNKEAKDCLLKTQNLSEWH